MCEGLLLDCTYFMINVWADQYYHCQARVIFVGHNRNVTEVSNNHLPGYTNRHVLSIDICSQTLRLPPRNIDEFFPNLASYSLRDTKTEVMHKNDIDKFPYLKHYTFQLNPATIIPPNMFANNHRLHSIVINGGAGRLQHVAYNVFDHLNHLTRLILLGPCISIGVNSRAAVLNNLFNIFRDCPPTLQMLREQLCQDRCFWN